MSLHNIIKWILPVLMFAGCKNNSEDVSQTNNTNGVQRLAVNVNQYKAGGVICDPLNGGNITQTSYEKGIKAELFYKTSSMPRWYKSTDYVQLALKSAQNIFLSDMNVPTRLFTEGFSTTQGSVLKDDQQNKLIEYFGLKMSTHIVLSDSDEEGYYEFALLSDDGVKMSIKGGDFNVPDQVLIDNDGDHPTSMGCSNQSIRMLKNVLLPVELTYYQGPRYHIANILMWRKSTVAGKDKQCGLNGNDMYFDPDKQSKPQKAFIDLLARGWKVLTPDNYRISKVTSSPPPDYNPCVNGTDPVISAFVLGEVILSSVSFSWDTDIASTSQIVLTNLATGVSVVTDADNILRTRHDVTLNNLQPSTNYKAKALSVSADLGRGESNEVFFTTQ